MSLTRSSVFYCLFASLVLTFSVVYTYTRVNGGSTAYAATSSTLNFQGRLLQSNGAVVPDGYYNIEFKLYDGGTDSGPAGVGQPNAGTLLWTETYYDSNGVTAGNDNRLRVINGYFTANLGSLTSYPGTVKWDQEHWITMNVGDSTQTATPAWDGEMLASGSARTKLTAVPYAFSAAQARKLIDEQLSGTGTLEFLALTANRTISLPDADGTVLLDSTGFANDGNSFAGTATLGTNDTNDLILETGGVEGLRIDQDGDVGIGTLADAVEALEVNGGIKLGNTSNTNAGTLRWTGTDFEGYNGSGWVSLTSGGGTTIVGGASANFVSGLANVGANITGTPVEMLLFTTATAVSNTIGVTGFTAPADGSFSTCLVKNTANITGGTLDLRWRVNGVSVGAAVCSMNNGANNRQSSSVVDPGVVTFLAGDTIGVAFDTVGMAPTTNDFTAYWSVIYETAGSGGNGFVQGGNSFGAVGTLGTTDANGLNIITNGNTRLSFTSTGDATFNDALTVNSGGLTVVAGGLTVTGNSSIAGTLSGLTGISLASGDLDLNNGSILNAGPDITAVAGIEIASSGSGDIALTSASGVIDFNGNLWRRVSTGTTTIQLNDASDTTLAVTNTGAGVANLDVEGLVTATGFSGSGAGLTSLDGSNISTGTVADGRLSSNAALLNGGQTFSALTNFSSGLVVGNTASATSGAIRFTGSDFEGYDGLSWVSLTSGGGGGGGNVTTVVKTANEVENSGVNATATLQPDDELLFPVGASETWSFRYVVQANAAATPDIKFAVNAPAGSTCVVAVSNVEDTVGVSNLGCGVSSGIMVSTGADEIYEIVGTVVTAGTAGNVTLQWAQNTPDAANVTVYAGSFVNAHPLSIYTAPPSSVYIQGGNSFGGTAILGTADANGLQLVTNGTSRLSFSATGDAIFSGDVQFNAGGTFDGALTANGGLTIGDNPADGLSIVSSNVTITNGLNFDSNTFVIDSTDNQIGINTSSAENRLTINAPSTVDASAQVSIFTDGVNNKALILQRTVGQIASLFEVQDESGNALSRINQDGGIVLGRNSFTNGSIIFNNSSNSFTSSFVPGALTADRTITLPNASGVVCLDSNNCSYIELASGTQQTDSSNNDLISINKTSATGNLLTLERNGTGVFTVFNDGALELQLDSANALSVLNSSGTSLFNVDTLTNTVQVGGLTADGSGVLFVLDEKNTAGDPAGVNGASYYNSDSGYMRCYENNVWQNCNTSGYVEYTFSAAANTWTNQPAADTEFMATQFRLLTDLSSSREFRFNILRSGGTVTAGADCRVQYSATYGGVYANLDGGAGPEIDVSGAAQLNTSGWVVITPGARADVYLRVMCKQGNGANDPQFRNVGLQVR